MYINNLLTLLTTEESKEYKKAIGNATKEYLKKYPEKKKIIIQLLKEAFKNIDFETEIPF